MVRIEGKADSPQEYQRTRARLGRRARPGDREARLWIEHYFTGDLFETVSRGAFFELHALAK
ncbi:MAG: hypothetical protein DMG32_24455 [Acidobacteria bacterium]|nr:MAG: hypothetical protein DMG32_24455 [Acidobacteriota bacterium]